MLTCTAVMTGDGNECCNGEQCKGPVLDLWPLLYVHAGLTLSNKLLSAGAVCKTDDCAHIHTEHIYIYKHTLRCISAVQGHILSHKV